MSSQVYSDNIIEKEVDFERYLISQKDFAYIYVEYLGYKSVLGVEAPDKDDQENSKNYAKVIDCLLKYKPKEYRRFRAITQLLVRKFKSECKQMSLTYSEWGNDPAWASWDLAKQLYFYMGKNVTRHEKYLISNPLRDRTLMRQIVDRHIGWEVETSIIQKGFLNERIRNDEKVSKIRFQWINSTGRMSSLGLVELGKRVRELMRVE